MDKITQFLKDISYNSKYEFLDEGKHKDELSAIANKRGIKLPAHDLAVFKCTYGFVNRQNLNGCTLPKAEVERTLNTLVGKAVDFDHMRQRVVGHWIDAEIVNDEIVAYGVFFKGNFQEDYAIIKAMMERDILAISFEAYGNKKITGERSYDLTDIEFSGGALLIKTTPAFPGSAVMEMAKDRVLEFAKVMIEPTEYMNYSVFKVEQSIVKYRTHDFETAECEYCRYFLKPDTCKVVNGEINSEGVCDAYQGGDNFKAYKVASEDILSFVKGMLIKQPYQHVVIKGINTPVGHLVLIKDTMEPKPHVFSLPIKFHIEHTSREHNWTQEEVDELIKIGKEDKKPTDKIVKADIKEEKEEKDMKDKEKGFSLTDTNKTTGFDVSCDDCNFTFHSDVRGESTPCIKCGGRTTTIGTDAHGVPKSVDIGEEKIMKEKIEALEKEISTMKEGTIKKEADLQAKVVELEAATATIEELKKESVEAKTKIEDIEKAKVKEIEKAKADAIKITERKSELGDEFSKDVDLLDDAQYELAKTKKELSEKDAEIAELKKGKKTDVTPDLDKGSKNKDVKDDITLKAERVKKFAFGDE